MSKLSSKQVAVLNLLEEGKEYQDYFFRTKEGLIWFYPLKERSYFVAENNPKPQENKEKGWYTIPRWNILDYLEKISTKSAKPENHQYAEELMQIIRDVTRPKDAERADNYRTWWYFIKIMSNLPTDVITMEDISLVGDWLDSRFGTTLVDAELGRSLLPKLLQSPLKENWKKAAKLVGIVTRIRWVELKYGDDVKTEPKTAIEGHWLGELFKKNASALGEKCGSEVIATLKKRLEEVFDSETDDLYSYIWRPAIEDHEQNSGHDTKNILASALRDILMAYAKATVGEAEDTLRNMLGHSLFTIRRIALYVVNELYYIYNELFWEVVSSELFNTHLRHELFELLKNHFRNFKSEQQSQVIKLIDTLEINYDGEEANKIMLEAQLKLDWLSAIKEQGNEEADNLYQKYLKISKYPPSEHPEFSHYQKSRWGHVSPYTTEKLLSMSVSEIVHSIENFKESNGWDEPTEEGFADLLKEAVKLDPEKFKDDLSLFIETKPSYQNAILGAFVEIWNDKKPIDWEKVLGFCLSVVESKAFWQQGDELQKGGAMPTRSWVTSTISKLIDTGVRNDDWAFEEAYLPKAKKIIRRILKKEPSTARGESRDALTEAINTPKGHCLEALINFSLRQARLADKQKNDHSDFWEHIQPIFDHELKQCTNGNFEFSALTGWYLSNLYYLSKDWVSQNIDRIFSVDYDANWRCAMEGYSYVRSVDNEIYGLLRKHGHLTKGLQTDFRNPNVRQELIQHISIAYLRGLETLPDEASLLTKVLQAWRREDISEIILFFSKNHIAIRPEDRAHALVLDFWKWCYERIRGQEEQNAEILSDLNLLAVFLKEGISEEQKSWLIQSAPYVEERYHGWRFLEYLKILVDENPEAVADVYIKMLTRTVPDMREEVRSIVEKLYQASLKEKANHIANEYGRKGYPDLLRDLYDQYNP